MYKIKKSSHFRILEYLKLAIAEHYIRVFQIINALES